MNPYSVGDLVLVKFVVFWTDNINWYIPNTTEYPYGSKVTNSICEVVSTGPDHVTITSKDIPYGTQDLPLEAVEAVFTL